MVKICLLWWLLLLLLLLLLLANQFYKPRDLSIQPRRQPAVAMPGSVPGTGTSKAAGSHAARQLLRCLGIMDWCREVSSNGENPYETMGKINKNHGFVLKHGALRFHIYEIPEENRGGT